MYALTERRQELERRLLAESRSRSLSCFAVRGPSAFHSPFPSNLSSSPAYEMCIIFWSQTVESYALYAHLSSSRAASANPALSSVLAANRDEFLHRPTTPAAWHAFALPVSAHSTSPSDTHRTLSGLDLEAGGTWLGISLPPSPTAPRLRFGTITNYTEMIVPSDRPTRGNLVKDFLVGDASLDSYLAEVERTKEAYAGYNLLLGELDASGGFRMGYASNREKEGAKARVLPVVREAAVVGLSNATLGGPGMREEEWPKVQSGCAAFEAATLRAAEEEQLEIGRAHV